MSQFPELPRLDCHAHIAPDVSEEQIERLGNVVVFSMTRTLNEAFRAAQRNDSRIMWGWGAHPGLQLSLSEYDQVIMNKLINHFPIIGEVGLDRRGSTEEQKALLDTILTAAKNKPVLISIHSSGRTTLAVNMISQHKHSGVILHWFLGSKKEIEQVAAAGAYFSVNSAMPMQTLNSIPLRLTLPETDFPAIQSVKGNRLPGDIAHIEEILARIHSRSVQEIRNIHWRNFKDLVSKNSMLDRMPLIVSDTFAKLE